MQAKNITAKQFAVEIGIQPSGMSHILSGRNNPSLEFVSKVIRRYPEIDANWLLLGKGEMYTSGAVESPAVSEPTLFAPPTPSPAPVYTPATDLSPEATPVSVSNDPTPASEPLVRQETKFEPEVEAEPEYGTVVASEPAPVPEPSKEPVIKEKPTPISDDGRRLVKILFFYDDHTFSEYRPE